MEQNDFKYSDITKKNRSRNEGAPHFGLGFPEVIYESPLIIELESLGLRYNTESKKILLIKKDLSVKEY